MYIIIKEENHPDRILEDLIGPFETYEEACSRANELYYSDSNYNCNYQHRLSTYSVRALTLSENAY